MSENFSGALPAAKATALRASLVKAKEESAAANRDCMRLQELTAIATTQAADLKRTQRDNALEQELLRKRLQDFEARSDDDRIIGKLQREIITMQTTYRLFARKYEVVREQLKHKATLTRKAEALCDLRDEWLILLRDEKRAQFVALQSTLGEVSRLWAQQSSQKDNITRTQNLLTSNCFSTVSLRAQLDSVGDFQKFRELACDVAELQYLTESKEVELSASEQAREQLEQHVEQLKVERDVSQRLALELKGACSQISDAASNIPESLSSAGNSTTRRMLSLCDEVAALKLQSLQDRRQVLMLREGTRRLETTVASHEAVLAAADRARVEAETRLLLNGTDNPVKVVQGGPRSPSKSEISTLVDGRALSTFALQLETAQKAPLAQSSLNDTGETSKRLAKANHLVIELTDKLRDAHAATNDARKCAEEVVVHACELGRALRFYEQATAHVHLGPTKSPGLEHAKKFVKMTERGTRDLLTPTFRLENCRTGPSLLDDRHVQTRLQQVATRTISSLKAVVEQKTQALMKSDERLENVRRVARREAAADKAEIERLTERLYQEHHAAINQLRSAVQAIESESIKDVENVVSTASSNSTAFVHETENANAELLQVCEENRQLEQNLHVSNCARERAELRCSEALGEIEAQKVDLVAMAAQLKEAEIVKSNAHYGQNLNFRVKMLQSSLSEKEARIRGLREALVKLKAEFVAAEEARAVTQSTERGKEKNADKLITELQSRAGHLSGQLHAIRSEAKASRSELNVTRTQRDKYKTQLEQTQRQVVEVCSNARVAESRCRELDDSLAKTRGECRELRTAEAQ